MPKQSQNSVRHDAVPRADVLAAFRSWAAKVRATCPELVRAGCFGSYARGDYGPSSDLDILVELRTSPHRRWPDRADDLPSWSEIPVGVEMFVFTTEEIERARSRGSAWLETVLAEAVWDSPSPGTSSVPPTSCRDAGTRSRP
jgi:predicted nucleotidyltransferase